MAFQNSNCTDFLQRSAHHKSFYAGSPLLQRLRSSNLAPTEQETSYIRGTILTEISEDIDAVEAQIRSLHETLQSIKRERFALLAVRKRYEGLISLRRTLPIELWSEVFTHLYHDPRYSLDDAYDMSAIHWTLGQVCQAWRNAVYSTPLLCSSLFVELLAQSTHRPSDVERLDVVLRRSGQHSLDINITDNDPEHPVVAEDAILVRTQMLSALFAQCHRWREVQIVDLRDAEAYLLTIQGRLPLLEKLDITFLQSNEEQDTLAEDLPSIHAFGVSPRLTKATIQGRRRLLALPWSQIKELQISDCDVSPDDLVGFTRLVGYCTSLETFHMRSGFRADISDPEIDPLPLISNEAVRKLRIGYGYVLDHLDLPALQEVFLDDVWETIVPFQALLLRSHCASTITHLTIRSFSSYGSADMTLLPILATTHNLQSLDIVARLAFGLENGEDLVNVSDALGMLELSGIIERLSLMDVTTPIFLPRLESLSIRISEHLEATNLPYLGGEGRLVETLSSRWAGTRADVARLQKFHVSISAERLERLQPVVRQSHWNNILTDKEVSDLEALTKDGLDLNLFIDVVVDRRGSHIWLRIPRETITRRTKLTSAPSIYDL